MDEATAARRLGQLLTGTEAKDIADRLTDGDTLTTALKVIAVGHRAECRGLLELLGTDATTRTTAETRRILALRAIEGARALPTTLTPLWTMPGHLAQSGPLTSSVPQLVDSARHSVTCSTFNFQRTSGLWTSLHRAAQRGDLAVRVYLDAKAADDNGQRAWGPSSTEVAEQLSPAEIWRTKTFDGKYVRNHAKFLIIDHHLLLVTSANFSWSAENANVEFGVLVDNPNLAEAVERELFETHETLYERVVAA